LEEEVVTLRKNLEKSQFELNMNLKHIKGSENLDMILNAHWHTLMKSSFGYEGETDVKKKEDKYTIKFVKSIIGDNDNQQQQKNKGDSNTTQRQGNNAPRQ